MQLPNPSPPCHITVSSSHFTKMLKTSYFWVIDEQLNACINPSLPLPQHELFI